MQKIILFSLFSFLFSLNSNAAIKCSLAVLSPNITMNGVSNPINDPANVVNPNVLSYLRQLGYKPQNVTTADVNKFEHVMRTQVTCVTNGFGGMCTTYVFLSLSTRPLTPYFTSVPAVSYNPEVNYNMFKPPFCR